MLSEVYAWPYAPRQTLRNRRVVVSGMNADGQGGAPHGHTTRSLAMDTAGSLYVSVGSAGNVDADSFRSRIRRCAGAAGERFHRDTQCWATFSLEASEARGNSGAGCERR